MVEGVSALRPEPTLQEIRRDPHRFPRLWKLEPRQAVARLSMVVGMAVQYRGQQIEADALMRLSKALYMELMADLDRIGLRYLSVEEISVVVRRAVAGSTKRELYGVNVASLLQVLGDYVRGEGAELQRRAENADFLLSGERKRQHLQICARIFASGRRYETRNVNETNI